MMLTPDRGPRARVVDERIPAQGDDASYPTQDAGDTGMHISWLATRRHEAVSVRPNADWLPKSRRSLAIVALVGLLLLGGVAYGVDKTFFSTPEVQVYTAHTQQLATTLGGGGLAYPAQTLSVSYPVNATVLKINVQVGQSVQKGDPLLTLNSADLTSQLQRAYAQWQAYARAAYAACNPDKGGCASAQAQAANYKAVYDALNSQINSATYSGGNVLAPFAGVVTSINVAAGSVATPYATLLTLQDVSSVVVRAQFPLEQRSFIQMGQSVDISPVATINQSFTGQVTSINQALTSPGSGTFEVWVTVPNDQLQLFSGETMYARIHVQAQMVTVPESAVLNPDSDSVVFVYSNGKAHLRHVAIGIHDNTVIGVSSGLQDGDQVILVGQYQLSDGQSVKVTGTTP
jgi:membrane fusion protein (multidrug efflux system)